MIIKKLKSIYNQRWYQKHGKEYYYRNHEKKKNYNRMKQTEYRRAKGILPKGGSNHWNWQGGRHKCIDCGNFVISRRKETSRCFSCNRKYLSGERNPMWNGGHTAWRKSLYSTLQYKQWRKAVLKRDKFTCQQCLKQNKRLEVHHKKRMIIIIKEFIPNLKNFKGYEIKNRLLDYKPLWDINNGVTLCLDCHKKERLRDMQLIKEALK